ncbi:MAG: [FeFe] hydrogenase H-cluster radical SAM maturase HydG [Deltaproteobacteria bacterium]|nr:[FeFe] hydrogenase H-cluster radical SAM maturase HydG [Deltaproteobacteria bacterium]
MIVDTDRIETLLKETVVTEDKVASVLERGAEAQGLTLEDAALLISIEDAKLREMLYRVAGAVKEKLFGKRVVLFAPLYLSNYCTNGCLYCGFRSSNRTVARKALTPEEVVVEAKTLEGMGFKRVLLVTGEDPRWDLKYIIDCVKAVYGNTGMRIVHVNAPPMDVRSLRRLKDAGVGVFQVFQETYHRPTYESVHPIGKKKDYDFRIEVMDRAMEAGFGDVAIGSLLGLYDFRFDSLATLAHSMHLYGRFGAEAHTISIPRLRPAEDFALKDVPHPVTDEDFKKIVAVYRLTVPTAGVVVSTREPASLRNSLIHSGATQLSAASRTNPGGYSKDALQTLEQFSTNDHRSLVEVMKSIVDEGCLPSLCTTCYRVGRTGHEFTEKTKAGEMVKFCQANAILTLKEYLADYSQNGTKEALEKALIKAMDGIKDTAVKKALIEKFKAIDAGERDLFL